MIKILVAALLLVSFGSYAHAQDATGGDQDAGSVFAKQFKQADTDGDGRLGADEARKGGFFVDESFEETDRDKDGYVTLFELGTALYGRFGTWSKADSNHDGKLSKDEADGSDVGTVFDRADLNRDGQVDEAEYKSYAQHGYYSETATQPLAPNIIEKRF